MRPSGVLLVLVGAWVVSQVVVAKPSLLDALGIT